MTAVEFYDRTPIENIISSLTTAPDKVIFLGDGRENEKFDPVYRDFLEKRKLKTVLDFKKIKRNNLLDIVNVLCEIVESEQDVVFDLTGGGDLSLVAMGMVFEKYKDTKNIQIQRFNFNNGVINDCDNDGNLIYSGLPEISVEENIRLNGGFVRYEQDHDDRTYVWDVTDDFIRDIDTMWEICKHNPGRWNTQLSLIGFADEEFGTKGSMSLSFDIDLLSTLADRKNQKYTKIQSLLRLLAQKRLINSLVIDQNTVSFSFKNEQIKKCLTKAGTVLEMRVFLAARAAKDKNSKPYFNDVMNGVFIDWDCEFHNKTDDKKDTENEIDVVLMKGLIPVFISCKNGTVDMNELYKLDAVTTRFGGIYARRVLVVTNFGAHRDTLPYIRQRAEDMNIDIIEDVHNMSDAKLIKCLKHVINS